MGMCWKPTIFLLSVLITVVSSSLQWKTCKESNVNIKVIENFNASNYLGTWYEIKKFPNFFESGICATAEYSAVNSTVFKVKNSELIIETENKTISTAEGYGKLEDPEKNDGKLIVVIENREAPYWIIGTDYTNYAVIYSCSDIIPGIISYHLSWVLSRTPQLSTDLQAVVDDIIKKNNLDLKDYVETEQNSKKCGWQ